MSSRLAAVIVFSVVLGLALNAQLKVAPEYTIAYASFAPLNTEIFIADADGTNAAPFLPSPGFDYNASFSMDGQWVIFTSDRGGSTDIYRARFDGSQLTRLTDDAAFDDQAALSPDGRYLAFSSSRIGNADVWILDLHTKALRNLTAHPRGDFRPAWSPDGEWLAFSSDRDTPGVRVNFATGQMTDIFVVHRDGSALRRLTDDHGVAGTASWSPNGATIVYYRAPTSEIRLLNSLSNSGTTQIVAVDVSSGAARTLTDGPGAKLFPRWLDERVVAYFNRDARSLGFTDGRAALSNEFQHPDWTPDRRRMIYHRDLGGDWPPFRAVHSREPNIRLLRTGVYANYSPDGTRMTMNSGRTGIAHNAILLMRPDGSERTTLFEDPVHSALAPVWSPRSDRIALGFGRFFPMVVPAAQGPVIGDVAVLDVSSRKLTVLTDGTSNVGFPSWSPDGERIVYRAWRDDASELRVIDTQTRQVTPLLTNFGRVNFPSWSPVGDLVQFTSDRDGDGNYEIFTIDVATRRITRVTNSPGNDGHAAWSPDGRWIAFSSVRQGFKDEAVVNAGNPQGSGDLYVVRPDGSDVRIVSDNQYEEATPGWAPIARR
jgi:Tol biopolymer transport system component